MHPRASLSIRPWGYRRIGILVTMPAALARFTHPVRNARRTCPKPDRARSNAQICARMHPEKKEKKKIRASPTPVFNAPQETFSPIQPSPAQPSPAMLSNQALPPALFPPTMLPHNKEPPQLGELDRFRQKHIDPRRLRLPLRLRARQPRESNDAAPQQPVRVLELPDPLGGFEAGHDGHADVHEDVIEFAFPRR